MKYAISLDIGGTSIKSAIVSSEGKIIENTVRQTPINSKGAAEEILHALASPPRELQIYANEKNLELAGIGIGMPGPCDYEKGICLIAGVDKFESIYGVNLKDEFRKRLNLSSDFPVLFEVDTWTFVRGEAWQGAGQGFRRIVGLTLGTGLGSGFMIDEEMIDDVPPVPKWGWIGNLPFKNGILDDRVSRRGIIRRYAELSSSKNNSIDVRDIAESAENSDLFAKQTFLETGEILGKTIRNVIDAFHTECIIVGGQIAKSYQLMSHSFQNELKDISSIKKITQAQNIERSALIGAARFLFKNLNKENE